MIKKLLVILVIAVVTKGCCKPDANIDNPCGEQCPPLETCVSGTCQCQEQTIRVGKNCEVFYEDSYFAIVDHCRCIDKEMLITTLPKQVGTSINNYSMGEVIIAEHNLGSPLFASYYDNPEPEGDSIVAFDFYASRCYIDSVGCTALLTGKFIGTDTFDAWIKWYPYNTLPVSNPDVKDSCHVVFIKPKK
jgi:hypothetical protein